MSDAYIGQVMLVSFGYAPKNWAQCDGAILPLTQYQALFSLLSTTYGGNGSTTFQLPDLRGRTPCGVGSNYRLGQTGGMESVTLMNSQMPQHLHTANYTAQSGAVRDPTNALYGDAGTAMVYAEANGSQVPLYPATVGDAGQTQPHANLQPYSVLNFCIALNGLYPPRT